MADYDWFSVSCCTGSTISGHDITCENNPNHSMYRYAKQHNMTLFWVDGRPVAYKCNRGCGCIIWDIDAHIENVCRR